MPSAAPASLALLPGVTRRKDPQESDDSPPPVLLGTAGPPGITPREERCERLQPYHERAPNYVTNTVTTPTTSQVRPRPLLAGFPGVSQERPCGLHQGDVLLAGRVPTSGLPKRAWSSAHGGNQGVIGATDTPPYSSSRASSVTSPSQMGPSRHDSSMSFHWAPERVFVQSWHQKLSETYADYNMVNLVGQGRHGAVFIVQHRRSEKYYACKSLNKANHVPDALRSEIELLRRLDHPNVVRLYETIEDRESVCLLMELCHGGDLFSRIAEEGHLPEKVARGFAEQMLSALAYCHSMGVVHRDIKPENFLLETEDPACLTLKLADFGIAAGIRTSKRGCAPGEDALGDLDGVQVRGSLPYMAPEMFTKGWDALVTQSRGSRQMMGAPDLWSCGVVVYVMLSGNLPYGDSVSAICSGEPPDFSGKVWQSVSPQAVNLIQKQLNPDIQARWTAQQALRHEWFHWTNTAWTESDIDAGPPSQSRQTGRSKGSSNPGPRRELARGLLWSLKRWGRHPKLKRIAIAAIAKRLEADHPAMRLAQRTYRAFNASGDKLRCKELVHELDSTLQEAMAEDSLHPKEEAQIEKAIRGAPESAIKTALSLGSEPSSGPTFSPPALPKQGRTLTGLHVRRNFKGLIKRLSRLSEETPRGSSLRSSRTPSMMTDEREELVSLTELNYLVDKLDGAKNGAVDYTLLVATLLPPHEYGDDARIEEVFDAFDFRHRGGIKPEDLQTYLSTAVRAKDLRHFSELVAPFDLNSDGELDFEEFRSMMLQEAGPVDSGDVSAKFSATTTDCTPPDMGSVGSVGSITPGLLPIIRLTTKHSI